METIKELYISALLPEPLTRVHERETRQRRRTNP
jgi:hypothetical protein